MAEADIRFLLKLRMKLTEYPQQELELWLDRADEAEKYYRKHGSLSMPNTELFADGVSMFQWIHHQKRSHKEGRLSAYQKACLEGMGIQCIRTISTVENTLCEFSMVMNIAFGEMGMEYGKEGNCPVEDFLLFYLQFGAEGL